MNTLQENLAMRHLCEGFNLNGTRSIRGLVMKWIRMHACEVDKDACVEFGKDTSVVFRNWKKSAKLAKHGKSENHVRSMTRWLQFKAMQRNKTSVLHQLNTAYQDQVASNRQYLKVIIQSLMYTAQQNVAIRGHEENRNDIWEVSDINRGNFLELLCIRCNDLPLLRSKLQSQRQLPAQWASPVIQNELLEIVANVRLERIAAEARSSDYYGTVVDETADISRTEQVSLSLDMFSTAKPKRHLLVSIQPNPRKGK